MRTLFPAALVAVCLSLTVLPSAQTDRPQARSMVISTHGIVAAESPLAAQAGVSILDAGGDAVDAAVATNAAMGVIAPMSNGIGGDLFAIVYDAKSGTLTGLNASGWAPAGASAKRLRDKNITRMPTYGIEAVTVPGAVDGWSKLLDKFGRKKLADVLQPAIAIADEGFPVTEWTSRLWNSSVNLLRRDPAAAKTYLPNNEAPKVGQIFRNPDLAASLRAIAAGGRDAFYKGDLARRIVDEFKAQGGTMTLDDLAQYSAEWVTPLSTTYRGWKVYELPPNGQGIAALEMLNLMETFPLGDANTAGAPAGQWGINQTDTLHTMIEAKKLAYTDLQKYIGEPRGNAAVDAAAKSMLDKRYAAVRAKQIDPQKANCNVSAGELPFGGDTIYLTVVDGDGNMVSLIQSNYEDFGSGLVTPGTGFVLHDRGALFNLTEGSPNELTGRHRPLNTIIPAFMEKDQTRIAFGIMGGWNQSQAHAQYVSHVVDYHENIQMAMEEARFTMGAFTGCTLDLEDRVPAGVIDALKARGHQLRIHNGYSNTFGGGQAVMRDFATGVNYGASDARKDGEAVPQLRGGRK